MTLVHWKLGTNREPEIMWFGIKDYWIKLAGAPLLGRKLLADSLTNPFTKGHYNGEADDEEAEGTSQYSFCISGEAVLSDTRRVPCAECAGAGSAARYSLPEEKGKRRCS